jgi:hypothetical protein
MKAGSQFALVQVAVGLTASGQPEQMATLDELVEELRRGQPAWRIAVGRSATTRTIQVRVQARGLDEALQLVRTDLRRHLQMSDLDPPPDIKWARPRQVEL